MPYQKGWKWCNKCQVLCFTGAGPGACQAGAEHDFGGSGDYTLFHYQMVNDVNISVHSGTHPVYETVPNSGQDRWEWCLKCQELCYAGYSHAGTCAKGGTHDYGSGDDGVFGSGDYVLMQGQSNWKWCNKCQALCFAGNQNAGPCPNGGVHDHGGSGDYTLLF